MHFPTPVGAAVVSPVAPALLHYVDDVVTILRAARDLLSDPTRWGTEHLAVDHEGLSTETHSQHAQCFCAMGAIMRVSKSGYPEVQAIRALGAQLPARFFGQVAKFNDDFETTHADVLRAFNRAIRATELAQRQQQDGQVHLFERRNAVQ